MDTDVEPDSPVVTDTDAEDVGQVVELRDARALAEADTDMRGERLVEGV